MRFFEERDAQLATVDVDTCFRRPRIGQSPAEWFCIETVRARDVSMNVRGSFGTYGSASAREPCPWDAVGCCTLHNLSMNTFCVR